MPRKNPNPRARKERAQMKQKMANKGKRSYPSRQSLSLAAEKSMSPGLAMVAMGAASMSSMRKPHGDR